LLLADLPDLKSHPDVASVKVAVECDDPRLTIIHIRDGTTWEPWMRVSAN